MKTIKLPFQSHSLREKLIEKLFDVSVKPYQWYKKSCPSWGLNKKEMTAMPQSTLGYAVGNFLDAHNFEVMDKCESHDVYHVLLGYATDVPSEIKMQYFLLGNGRLSWYTWLTVVMGMLILPEHCLSFGREMREGLKRKSIKKWDLPKLLQKNAEILRGRSKRKARRFFILKYLIIKFLRRFYQSFLYKKIYTFRENTLSAVAEGLTFFYKKIIPRNPRWQYSKKSLSAFPDGSVGKEVANFLEKNKFDFLPFLETHDVYHVLFGYKTTLLDEARLYFFLLGNGKRSLEVWTTVLVSILVLPDCWLDLAAHYRRGKATPRLSHLSLGQLLSEKSENLAKNIRQKPTDTEGVDAYHVTRFFFDFNFEKQSYLQ